MIITNTILAYFCNDLQNTQNYMICGNDCYYKNELIGRIFMKECNEEILDIYYQPIKPIEHIVVNFTFSRNDIDFNDNLTPKPSPPLTRIIREGVGYFCNNCGSTASKNGFLGLFGKRKCDNQNCPNSKSDKNIKFWH